MPLTMSTVRQIRRGVIVMLAVATTVLAITLIVHALSPQGLGLAPTSQLLAILLLLTLPACTIAAWAWDRAVRKRTAAWAAANTNTDTFYRLDDLDIDSQRHAETDQLPALTRAREHPAGRARPHGGAHTDLQHEPEHNTDLNRLSR